MAGPEYIGSVQNVSMKKGEHSLIHLFTQSLNMYARPEGHTRLRPGSYLKGASNLGWM